jgi:hypothetical protein
VHYGKEKRTCNSEQYACNGAHGLFAALQRNNDSAEYRSADAE